MMKSEKNPEGLWTLKDRDARPLTIRSSETGWVLMWNDEAVYSFDLNGRPRRMLVDGKHYQRAADHRTFRIYPPGEREANEVTRELCGKERRSLYETELQKLRTLYETMRAAQETPDRGLAAAAVNFFSFVNDPRTLDLWEKDFQKFYEVYKTLSILPPDQYRALVIQVSEGCPWNRCTFCDLYSDREFCPKSLDEVKKHIRSIKSLMARALGYYRSIFLSDANALAMPRERLIEILDLLHLEFFEPGAARLQNRYEGIYSFVDARTGFKKTAADLKAFRDRGLKRLYLGLESGGEGVREFLNKPGTNDEIETFVTKCRAAGIALGVIILIGVGGERFQNAHTRETIALLRKLELGKDDIVYLSKFIEHNGSDYQRRARQEKIRPLSDAEMDAQIDSIKQGIQDVSRPEPPRVAVYTLDRFIY